jgi:hypothetical protein
LPDFLGDYKKMTVLTQQLFRDVKELIKETSSKKIEEIRFILGNPTADLESRL